MINLIKCIINYPIIKYGIALTNISYGILSFVPNLACYLYCYSFKNKLITLFCLGSSFIFIKTGYLIFENNIDNAIVNETIGISLCLTALFIDKL